MKYRDIYMAVDLTHDRLMVITLSFTFEECKRKIERNYKFFSQIEFAIAHWKMEED